MRWSTRSLVAVGLGITTASPAHACGLWINSTYLPLVPRATASLGLQSVENYMIIAADVAIRVGDMIVIRPAVGQCRYTGTGGGSDMVFGGAVGANVWKDADNKTALNIQAGAEMVSYDGGNERNIPIGVAVRRTLSEVLAAFAGAAMHLYNDEYDGDSYSSNDPAVYGGLAWQTGNFTVTGGITMYMYDGGNDMAINVGGSMALGGASSAIKRIGSLLRK
jgi:hypothetical protein